MDEVKVAAISMCSTDDYEKNLHFAFSAIVKAAEAGCNWIALPEVFAYHGPYKKHWELSQNENGPLWQKLSELAASLKVVIFAGSMLERPEKFGDGDNGKVFNTSAVFCRDHGLVAKYRKVHLFNLNDPDSIYNESLGFLAGDDVKVVEIDGWKVGLSICYDLRFPEFYAKMAATLQPDVVFVPSAFTKKTGTMHWEILLRARAIEMQCAVVAPNQTGTHRPGKESFGHSMIIGPMGEILAASGDEEKNIYATLSKSEIIKSRRLIPSLENRRPEVYTNG